MVLLGESERLEFKPPLLAAAARLAKEKNPPASRCGMTGEKRMEFIIKSGFSSFYFDY